MENVRVSKAKLIEALESNKKAHILEFAEAMEGYREELAKQLTGKLEELASGGLPNARFDDLPLPANYVEEYETALSMLSYSVDDDIELSSDAFRNYVLDDWGWKSHFNISTMNYKK